MKRVPLLVLLAMALLVIAGCSTGLTEEDMVARVEATVQAIPAQPSLTPYPTYTLYPTYTTAPSLTPEPTETPRPTPTFKPTPVPTPTLAIPARGAYEHPGYEVVEEYDKFNDWYNVSVSPWIGERGFDLMVGFSVEGQTTGIPDELFLMLNFVSDSWRYLDCHSTAFLVDGERRLSPVAEHDGRVRTYGVSEYINAVFTLDEFLMMANAASVEVKICNDEFTFGSVALEALRDVASRMVPEE